MIVNMFFKVIMPFVDPITRQKIKFNPSVVEDGIFDEEQLMSKWWDGSRDFEYDHAQYWPALVKMTEERRKAQMQRWRELGGKIGTSEWEMKKAASAAPPAPELEKISESTTEVIDAPAQVEA